jgi:uncharacterized protein YecT (DUF1311 family)
LPFFNAEWLIPQPEIERNIMRRTAFTCLLAASIAPSLSYAQSFNCRYARSADEVLICQDEHLSRLDVLLSGTYYRLRNSLYGRERGGGWRPLKDGGWPRASIVGAITRAWKSIISREFAISGITDLGLRGGVRHG